MINELEGLSGSSYNGKPTMRTGDKSPERSGWEVLAWAILEQAVDDLATFARYGLITPEGHCLPWPFAMQRRMKRAKKGGWQYFNYRQRANICCSQGPHEHRQLRAWFLERGGADLLRLDRLQLGPPRDFSQHDQKPRRRKTMSHEMEMEDYMVDLRRKVAIVEEQNQALREQNSRLTLALDEALAIARRYRGGNQGGNTLSSNLAGEMLVGRVGFGESFQACSASNSAIDAMAVSIVRLYRECDELRASLAMVEAERDLLRGKLNNLQGGQNE
jgi:hypothetical protein